MTAAITEETSPPYTYLWNTGETTQSITVTTPGEYCCTVTDDNGCQGQDCGDAVMDPAPVVEVADQYDCATNEDDPECDPENAFEVTMTANITTETTPPYSYLWNTGETTQSITVGAEGEYCCTVTDGNGCKDAACGDAIAWPLPVCELAPPDPLPPCNTPGNTLCGPPDFDEYEWELIPPVPNGWEITDGDEQCVEYTTGNDPGPARFRLRVTEYHNGAACKGCCYVEFQCEPQDEMCLLIIDEDTIDNGMSTIEQAAWNHGVTPDYLVNDDNPVEIGNPWLRWNTEFPGDIVLLPAGQVDDEGLFALPENTPWSLEDFAAGTVPQSQLDKIADVMPIRNQDLVGLIGQTCTAVVYDSDISMNYDPINANLQGARYGRFTFTVLAVEVPGAIPEAQSSTSLYSLWVRVEEPMDPTYRFDVTVRDHEPDAIEIERARYSSGRLTVEGESDFAPTAFMTTSVDGPDQGYDHLVDPFLLEAAMAYQSGNRYKLVYDTPTNLVGRRITISTAEGGAYNDVIGGHGSGGLGEEVDIESDPGVLSLKALPKLPWAAGADAGCSGPRTGKLREDLVSKEFRRRAGRFRHLFLSHAGSGQGAEVSDLDPAVARRSFHAV
jgi:hypothetical protein